MRNSKTATTTVTTQTSPTIREARQDEYCSIQTFFRQLESELHGLEVKDGIVTPTELYEELANLRKDLVGINRFGECLSELATRITR